MNNNRNIIWKYIDTEKASIKALEDYQNMKKLQLILSTEATRTSDPNSYRIQQNKEFLEWFEPSWNALEDEEKLILKEFYMTGNLKSGAGIRLQLKLNYSERHLHRLRGDAIAKLSMMLFGK